MSILERVKEKWNKFLSWWKERNRTKVVIDASITGHIDLDDIFSKILASDAKIVLTSVTRRELNKLQKHPDLQGRDARHILDLAAKNPDSFGNIVIDEALATADDCIVNYCAQNKRNVILLCSDKEMTLKAREKGIRVEYLVLSPQSSSYVLTTLPVGKYANGRLVISDFSSSKMSVRLISNGKEYNSGTLNLRVGDKIFIVHKLLNGLLFEYYKIVSLSSKNNCRLIFFTRVLKHSQIASIENEDVKKFIRDCMCRFPL